MPGSAATRSAPVNALPEPRCGSNFLQKTSVYSSSTANYVDDSEYNDPNDIYEMPVHRKHIDSRQFRSPHSARQRKQQHDDQHQKSRANVKTMQPHKRVVSCAKKIRGDRQTIAVNEPVPFLRGSENEKTAEDNGREPKREKPDLTASA